MNATIRIPIKADGSYDLDLQKEIAEKYEKIDLIKAKVQSLSNDLNTLLVE